MAKKKQTEENVVDAEQLESATENAEPAQESEVAPPAEAVPNEAPPVEIQATELETEVSTETLPDSIETEGMDDSETKLADASAPEAEIPQISEPPIAEAGKKSFYELDINKLDRNLSPEEAQEWNSIYASFRSKSILSGIVIGVDENTFEVKNSETGEIEEKTINSLIIVNYRAKILIPERELWMPDDERPLFVAKNMVGSTVDYVVIDIDREGGCAIASRRLALMSRRYFFGRNEHNEGDRLTCRVISVGPKLCLVECYGFDRTLIPRELSYSAMTDLREKFRPGMELGCIIKKYSKEPPELEISVKEALPNPFDGADKRHPVGSRRQATISGKYKGGVFCTLPDGTVCHCLYASRYSDADFRVGDAVIIAIREFNYPKQQMFGRIIGKW